MSPLERATDVDQATRPEPLPERARLLHVGMMKSGTTSIQRAASARRRLLLRHGVRYPGRLYNHRQAALALMRRRAGDHRDDSWRRHDSPADAPADAWTALKAEIEADSTRRILISNEFIGGWDDEIAARFLAELGKRTHVVVTVRSYAATLPSVWQQYVKTGYAVDLDSFLREVLAEVPDPARLQARFAQHEQAEIVRRWARLAGPDRVSVVVGTKADPRRLEHAFETMLGLPVGLLSAEDQGGFHRNRSLSAEEAALLLRVNQLLEPYEFTQTDAVRVLRNRVAAKILDAEPPSLSSTLTLPAWAAERAAEVGARNAALIKQTGVRVVGDLGELSRIPRAGNAGPGQAQPGQIATEVAAQAIVGALTAALSASGLPQTDPRPVWWRRQARRVRRVARRRLPWR